MRDVTIKHQVTYSDVINIRLPIWEGLVRLFMKKETWKFILQTLASILTAIATTLGVTSCMGY